MLLPAKDDHKARGLKYRDEAGGYGFCRLIYRRGIVFALKIGLEEKGRTSLPAVSSYKLPGQVKELLRDLENLEWRISLISPKAAGCVTARFILRTASFSPGIILGGLFTFGVFPVD